MYPSDAYVNNAFSYNDFNPTLGIQDLSSISSPFNLYEDEAIYSQHLHAILCATNQGIVPTNDISAVTANTQNSTQIDINLKQFLFAQGTTNHPVVKNKMGKKDRHSKINTAHGLRDRRMRLSLDVARKFFQLQDMLGHDKPSQTVEWLLKQSKTAIEEQFGGLPHMNKDSSIVTISASYSTSDDVVSGIDESIPRTSTSKTVLPSTCSKEKRSRSVRKPIVPPRAKESRQKAREIARERTKEKRKQKIDVQQSPSLMTWRPLGTGEGTSYNTPGNYNQRLYSVEVQQMQNARKHQLQSQGIREEGINISDPNIYFITGNCSPSVLFNYHQTSGIFDEQYQFTDF